MRQTIEATVLTTPEATVVEVEGSSSIETYRGNLKATGYAKKHPNDTHDPEVGHSLAMARALRELADTYEKRAWERINHPLAHAYATGGTVTTAPKFSYELEGKFDHKWFDTVLRGEKIGRLK